MVVLNNFPTISHNVLKSSYPVLDKIDVKRFRTSFSKMDCADFDFVANMWEKVEMI